MEIPRAYYEFTNNLSREEALQSIGAVCCRVTSARFCPIQKSKRPPFVPPYIRGRGVGDPRFTPESIITRVLYCLTLTQLLSNNADGSLSLSLRRVRSLLPSRPSIELFDLLLFSRGGIERERERNADLPSAITQIPLSNLSRTSDRNFAQVTRICVRQHYYTTGPDIHQNAPNTKIPPEYFFSRFLS